MKLIRQILVSLLFLAFLVPFTALWQEETSARNGTCPGGGNELDIKVKGTGKSKQQALDDLYEELDEIADEFCSGTCLIIGTCKFRYGKITKINCKERRRDKGWVCRTRIKYIDCTCLEL